MLVWPVGWLVGELPLHHLALWSTAGVALAVGGGLDAWPGWIGLAALLLGLAGLRQHLVYAARTAPSVEAGLRAALDPPGGADDDHGDRRGSTSWRTVATVFPFRPRRVRRRCDLEYARVDGRSLRLDVYHRDDVAPGAARPVFVYVHGGGWVIGNKGQQGRLTVHELAAAGWVCVSVNYRLSPRATFPDHLIDVKRALAWVKGHIAAYGGDPDFVMIGGGSAGAHLASLAALTPGKREYQPGFADVDLTVQGCVAYYGVYDFVDRDRHFRHRAFHDLVLARLVMKQRISDAPDAYERASPTAQVSAAAPPFLVWHGDRDSLAPVTAARAFVAALRDRGTAPCAYVELAGAQHAFELFPSVRSIAVVNGTRRFCQAVWSAWRARVHSR